MGSSTKKGSPTSGSARSVVKSAETAPSSVRSTLSATSGKSPKQKKKNLEKQVKQASLKAEQLKKALKDAKKEYKEEKKRNTEGDDELGDDEKPRSRRSKSSSKRTKSPSKSSQKSSRADQKSLKHDEAPLESPKSSRKKKTKALEPEETSKYSEMLYSSTIYSEDVEIGLPKGMKEISVKKLHDPSVYGTDSTSATFMKASDFEKDLETLPDTYTGASSEYLRQEQNRPEKYDNRIFTAIYLVICLYIMVVRAIVPAIQESMDDGYWLRCIWLLAAPCVLGMMLFPAKVVVSGILGLFGSWKNIRANSKTHSAFPPPVPKVLPRVIVQMPVYKEDFEETIKPSLEDIRGMIEYYRGKGGEAYMFINDDGLQLISEEDRQERLDYYHLHNIAYIARPAPATLARRGLFKKASNMNFCLNFAMDVDAVQEEKQFEDHQDAIQHVIDSRPYPVLAGGPVGMAGVRNILLVDSDTRVPRKGLHQTVGEFDICPNLGFCQHNIGVLRVEDNYWEDFLANFTDLLYSISIAMGTANGDSPPLVGHNATLSWPAMKDASWFDEDVDYRCFWSEMHVSEDFDMSMRLQSQGYCGRYIMYTGTEFQEGVSISVFDEIIKLKKYSYGTGEMLFNKFKDWPCKGPFSPLITKFMVSGVRWDVKVNILSYLFTYVAMTWAVILTPMAMYVSLFSDETKHMQMTSFEILAGCFIIFFMVGSTTTILYCFFLRRDNSLITLSLTQLKHIPIVTIFFSGLLYHIAVGLFRYMFDLSAEWGATSKEMDNVEYTLANFCRELYETIQRYWFMYILCFLFAATLVVLYATPYGPVWLEWDTWAVSPFIVMVMSHALMPILLNANAMYSLFYPLFGWCCCCCCSRSKKDDLEKSSAKDSEIEDTETGREMSGRDESSSSSGDLELPRATKSYRSNNDLKSYRTKDSKSSRTSELKSSRSNGDLKSSRTSDLKSSRTKDSKSSRASDLKSSRSSNDLKSSRTSDLKSSRPSNDLKSNRSSRTRDSKSYRTNDLKSYRSRSELKSYRSSLTNDSESYPNDLEALE